jgi:hypothetical protein
MSVLHTKISFYGKTILELDQLYPSHEGNRVSNIVHSSIFFLTSSLQRLHKKYYRQNIHIHH